MLSDEYHEELRIAGLSNHTCYRASILAAVERIVAREKAATEALHRDLVSRLGFGDGITEPMADNDTIVKWFHERGRDADEWTESQQWRVECVLVGHSEDQDCFEHDPMFAEARGKAAALREAADAHDGPAGPLAFITPEGREWLHLRAEWLRERADRIEAGEL